MEGQYIPGGEPPKVRARKPKPRDLAVEQGSQGGVVVQGQQHQHQPPIRKISRGPKHQQQQVVPPPPPPEAGSWDDGYGNADPGAHYGYGGDEQYYVDHGYDYGGGAHAGYEYAGTDQGSYAYHDVANQGYDYAGQDQYGGYAAAPTTQPRTVAKEKPKPKPKPKPVADQGSYATQQQQHQVDGAAYGQPVQPDGSYAHPDAYNNPDPKAHATAKKPKEKRRSKPKKTESQYDDFPVPDRSIGRGQGDQHDDVAGSARSRTSQEGSQTRSKSLDRDGSHGPAPARTKSSDRDGSGRAKPPREGSSGSGRIRAENNETTSRSSRDGNLTARPNPISKDSSSSGRSINPDHQRRSGRVDIEHKPPPPSNPNRLSEHMRKTTKARPNVDMSMVVFHDPNDRTLIEPSPPPSRNPLDDWVKQQSELSGGNNRFIQHESLIVLPDDNKDALETHMFGAPLSKKPTMKLPPVIETTDKPQYEPRGGDNHHFHHPYQPVVELPLYQPGQRRPYAKSPQVPRVNEVHQDMDMEVYDAEGKQVQVPNAKCMACVHGIAVPIATLVTRIACVQCRQGCASCTIL